MQLMQGDGGDTDGHCTSTYNSDFHVFLIDYIFKPLLQGRTNHSFCRSRGVLLAYTYANSDTHFSTLPAYVITFDTARLGTLQI